MISGNRKPLILIGTLLSMLILATAAYAFTAANIVSTTARAGDGHETISGYTISNVVYTLDNTSPQNIAGWGFDLNAAATSVRSKLVSSSSTYTACVHGAGFHWTCSPGAEPSVATANELRVIAVQ
jgi:hypothetical protein